MSNPKTYLLVKSLQKGDLSALEEIYKTYYPKLIAFSKKFSSPALEPEDFVHQTFLKLWDERRQLKEDVLLDKQIYVICKNLIINQLSRDKKMLWDNNANIAVNDAQGSSHWETSSAKLKRMHAEIDKLPKKRKEIFLLHKLENLTYQEIAEYLCISKKTIAHQIYLANIFLQEELRKK